MSRCAYLLTIYGPSLYKVFGEHMEINHEKLRSKFVNFDGKKTIKVKTSSTFKKGSKDNPWPNIFSQFSKHVRKNIGDKNHNILLPNFSTTTPTCKVVHELSMMHAMKHYFAMVCMTMCGISKVKLLGTLEDWEKLRNSTKDLNEYGLDWWTNGLIEILDKIIQTYQGKNPKNFWKYIFKYYHARGGSGSAPYINGWILNFFPYFNKRLNKFAKRSLKEAIDELDRNEKGSRPVGVHANQVKGHKGLCLTPFLWDYHGTEFNMNFISGFSGATMTEDGYIMPVLSWAIAEKDSSEEEK